MLGGFEGAEEPGLILLRKVCARRSRSSVGVACIARMVAILN